MLWCNTAFAGCTEGDCSNGKGTRTFTDGAKYVGEFKDGIANGKGTHTFTDGAKYVGEFKDGIENGKGTYTFTDGAKYVGEFKDGKYNGQGTYTFDNGASYVGEWKDGKRHGKGTFMFIDGRKYVDEFFENKRKGPGVMTYPDGRKYVGKYKKGYRKNGLGVMTYPDGTVKKGFWGDDIFFKTEKQYLKYHRKNHKIKKDVKLRCMLTYVDPYKQGESSFNEFYLTIDSINNQIIAGSFVKKWGLLNIIYDEINSNEEKAIIANTIIDYGGQKAHMRLYLDRFTGKMTVLSDVDYNDEGTKKSLEDKITGEGYSYSGLGHRASCVKKML